MKRLVCLFLLLWLPCFTMAAQVMTLQMQWSNVSAAPHSMMPSSSMAMAQPTNSMPCPMHTYSHRQQALHLHTQHAPAHSTTHAHCNVCGFCVISNGVAHIVGTLPEFSTAFASTKPLGLTVTFHTLSYPPAIKPPILA